MEWVFLAVGVLFVAAVWDIGRRVSDKSVVKQLESRLTLRIAALETRASESDELSEQVAELAAKVGRVGNGLEAVKAQSGRPRNGFPRF